MHLRGPWQYQGPFHCIIPTHPFTVKQKKDGL